MVLKFDNKHYPSCSEIDFYCKKLSDNINAMSNIINGWKKRERAIEFIISLQGHFSRHISLEEKRMNENLYPDHLKHSLDHSELLKKLSKLSCDLENNGITMKFTLGLKSFLLDWLVVHYRYADSSLINYLNVLNSLPSLVYSYK